jgi:hypothetical protein
MTRRQDLVQAVRRRTLEIMLQNDAVDFDRAERQAAAEIKAIAKARTPDPITQLSRSLSPPGGARARLGAALAAIAARASAAASIIPRALTPAPPVREVQRSAPRIEQSPEEPPGDVTLIFAGGPRGAQFIPDTEFPPGLQSLPLANWKASIAANNARRGGSS